MQFHYILEILRLLVTNNKKDPQSFVSFFNASDYIIAFYYDGYKGKFTHLSKSYDRILGYRGNHAIGNQNLAEAIIHPQDKTFFRHFLNIIPKNGLENDWTLTNMKCRARHVKGDWKYLVFLSMNYFNHDYKSYNKFGLIVDQKLSSIRWAHADWDGHLNSEQISSYETNEEDFKIRNGMNVKISARENEILSLISQGMIAKEIANELNISVNTVICHRKNLKQKFDVKNTAELISTASHFMMI
jgi:DNA-binding CsgD family transcriptional regulator